MYKRLADNRNAASMATKLRRRRFQLFLDLLADVLRPVRILDIGGTQTYWEMMGLGSTDTDELRVSLLNPAATTPGPTSALNYGPGAVLANTTVIVGAQGGAADFTVALNGPPHSADVVIDAIGYYYAPAATALDCTTAQHNVQVNHGGNFNDVGATCPTGYTISSGGCHWFNLDGTPASGNTVLVNRGTRQYDSVNQVYLNGWTCRMTNDDSAIDFNISVRAMCCRVPGH